MTHTVEKIGGTSIADTSAIVDNVLIADRGANGCYGRIFVLSAYAGMTDLLLEHKKTGEPGVYSLLVSAEHQWAWSDALSDVAAAMSAKNLEVFGDNAIRRTADQFLHERIEGIRNCLIDLHRLCSYGQFRLQEYLSTVREMLASVGEAHSAFNTALLLRQRGVNASFVDLTGWRDDRKLNLTQRIEDVLGRVDVKHELPIVTGYAGCTDGMVRLYDRGYTEVTFSRIAVLTGACEAIIHKEFHLSTADPKLVGTNRVRKIGATNYDVADQLSNMGMEAVHPAAAKGLRQADIPLRVKNTYAPSDSGTLIQADFSPPEPRAEIITGLAQVFALEVFEQDMVGVKGYDAEILKALTRHRIRIVTKCSNANTITHYVNCPSSALEGVTEDLRSSFHNADITVRDVALISVIGANLNLPGLTATAVGALASADVNLIGIHQQMRNTDLQLIVSSEQYKAAVVALHAALIEARCARALAA